MTRKAFVVYVDLDEVPGEFHSQESALHALRNVLRTTIGHYNPMVSLAPEALQPEIVDNAKAVVEDGNIVLKELPKRPNDYLFDFSGEPDPEHVQFLKDNPPIRINPKAAVVSTDLNVVRKIDAINTSLYETPNMYPHRSAIASTEEYDANAYNLGNAGLD